MTHTDGPLQGWGGPSLMPMRRGTPAVAPAPCVIRLACVGCAEDARSGPADLSGEIARAELDQPTALDLAVLAVLQR